MCDNSVFDNGSEYVKPKIQNKEDDEKNDVF